MVSIVTNIITSCAVVLAVIGSAIGNILAYPISKKLCLAISRYITDVCAIRVFAIMNTYKHFKTICFKDHKEELPENFIIMSNHQSLLDIPLYMKMFHKERNCRFVAKDELARHVPLVSEMLRAEEHCMIPRRGSPSVAMKTIDNFGKRVVERKQVPVIFPEGTRSKDGSLGTFYAAGFRRLCEATKLPVVVCALDGAWKLRGLDTFFENLHNGTYRVKIVGVFPAPNGKEEQVDLLTKGKELIQAQLDEWRKA